MELRDAVAVQEVLDCPCVVVCVAMYPLHKYSERIRLNKYQVVADEYTLTQ